MGIWEWENGGSLEVELWEEEGRRVTKRGQLEETG